MKKIRDIDEYITSSPKDVQKKLRLFRATINKLVPGSTETIGYGIPTFKINSKNLVHFAVFKNHIGFYPSPSGISAFKKDLLKYKTSKGAIQFPLEGDLPTKLIEKIVKFRLKEVGTKSK